MKMRYLSLLLVLVSFTAGVTLRAATKPHADKTPEINRTWTNDDLEKLHDLSLISIVGPTDEQASASETSPGPYEATHDEQWYAERSVELHAELERRETQLRQYMQALEDAQSLRKMTGGINLDEGDIAITPEAAIEILQRRVGEQQARLDALEDMARRDDIPPGALRGQ
jgi:hypothetical protein